MNGNIKKDIWGKRIRTSEWRDQNPQPYHLAMPQMYVIIYHNNKNKKKSQFIEDLVSDLKKWKLEKVFFLFFIKEKNNFSRNETKKNRGSFRKQYSLIKG